MRSCSKNTSNGFHERFTFLYRLFVRIYLVIVVDVQNKNNESAGAHQI